MGENRLRGEAGELGEGVARFAVLAGMMRQLEGADGETHEAEARRKQPHLLPHLTEAVRDPVREDAEVADAPIELEAGKQVEGGVEEARRMPLDEAVAFLGAHAGDGVEAALPDLGIEERDILGRVLEVAVHDHVPVGTGVVDAGGERVVLAEVPAELHAFRPRGARRLWSRGGGLVPELAPSARRGAPGALPCRGRCRRSSPAGNVLRLLAADTVLQPPRAGGGAPASARDRAPRRPRTRSIAPCRSRGACRPDRRDGEAACGGRLCGAVPRGDGPAAARAAADRCPARVRLWLHGGRGRRVGGPAAVGDRLGADAGLHRDARRGCAGRTGSDCRTPGVSRPPARLAVRGGPDRGGPRREGRAVRLEPEDAPAHRRAGACRDSGGSSADRRLSGVPGARAGHGGNRLRGNRPRAPRRRRPAHRSRPRARRAAASRGGDRHHERHRLPDQPLCGCPRSRGPARGNGGEAQRRSRRRRALPRPRHWGRALEGSGEALPARCPDMASDGAGRDRNAGRTSQARPPRRRFVRSLRDGAMRRGFCSGDPIIDLSGELPGIAVLLGGGTPGLPWLFGGYPFSERLAGWIISGLDPQTRGRAWLVVAEGRIAFSAAFVAALGFDLAGAYDLAFDGSHPRYGTPVRLYRPRAAAGVPCGR